MSNIDKVRAGDSILSHFTHEAFNAFAEAAKDRGGPPSVVDPSDPAGNGCRVWIQNNTGSDLDRYAVVGLGAPVFGVTGQSLTSFLNQSLIAGALPVVATHAYRFAVLLQSVPNGSNGEALVIGVTPVQVMVNSITDTYADVTAGITSYLTSGTAGGAKLLTTPTTTGLQWCLVRVGIQPVVAWKYVEFDLSTALSGFNTSGGAIKLDATHTTGWLGSTVVFGSENDAGIEYQFGETAPQTNGLFKALRDGTWIVRIYSGGTGGALILTSTETNPPSSGTEATGAASTGTAHTHQVTKPGMTGPRLDCVTWKKPVGGGAISQGFFKTTQSFPYMLNGETSYQMFNWSFPITLVSGDKLSWQWDMSSSVRTAYNFTFPASTDLRVSFTAVGLDNLGWAAIS